MYKKMYIDNDLKWASSLSEIQESYNNRKRDSLMGLSPLEILSSKENIKKLKKKYAKKMIDNEIQYGRKKPRESDIRVGDTVRYKIRNKNIFTKSYVPKFSEETVKVTKVSDTQSPKMFYLGAPAPQGVPFYQAELSRVLSNSMGDRQKDLYIAGTKKIAGRQTRSGQKSGQEILYLLKSRQRPGKNTYITETERDRLMKKGLISS